MRVSDLTSEGGTAGELTTSTSTNTSTGTGTGTVTDTSTSTGTSTKSSSSSSDGPGAAGGLQSRRRRLDGSTVDSRNTAEILEGHLLQFSAWRVTAAAGSTVGSNDTSNISEIIAARQRRRRRARWRRVRPKILAVARFQWMLSRIRRLEDLRSVLDRRVAIDELVVREIAACLGLLPLLPPHEPSQRIVLIDLDIRPAEPEEIERRRRG